MGHSRGAGCEHCPSALLPRAARERAVVQGLAEGVQPCWRIPRVELVCDQGRHDYLLPTTYYLLPTTYYLLLTTYYLLLTTHYLLLTTYYLLLTTHHLPLTTYYL